jgi:putative hydrolase of HD superfamily
MICFACSLSGGKSENSSCYKDNFKEFHRNNKKHLKIHKSMQTDNLLKQVSFIKEIDKLKYIQRKTKLFNSDRCENYAEHSWHLAMMTIVLAEHSDKPIDVLKVLKMVLIHDIVEIDAGDVFLYDTTKSHTNTDEELIAAKRIFGLLPTEQAEEFIAVWQEFEDGITDEAKFAKSMDRFEPLLQNTSNNGGTWAEYNVPYQKVYDKKKVIKEGSATIWNYAENLINESVDKGILKK